MDETWDFTDEVTRPAGVPPVPLARVPGMHFGVVVEDVVASMRRYADLFSMPEVTFFEIGTPAAAPKARAPMVTLGNATYHGRPVEHRVLSTLTPVADFGFEVLQVTVPPIHYKEDFYDQVGEGIHHFYATELNGDEQWATLRDWMASIGYPVVQSGDMNCGHAQRVGGVLLLGHARPAGRPRARGRPRERRVLGVVRRRGTDVHARIPGEHGSGELTLAPHERARKGHERWQRSA